MTLDLPMFVSRVALVDNAKDYNTVTKGALEVPPWPQELDCYAFTRVLRRREGGRLIVVGLNRPMHKSREALIGTMVHEAVHVFQYCMDRIGEDEPGTEVEAYTVESITMWMLKEGKVLK